MIIMVLEIVHDEILHYFNSVNMSVYQYYLRSMSKEDTEQLLEKIYCENKNCKKIIIFVHGDYEFEIKSYENQIIVRSSALKSLIKSNEVVMPFLWSPVLKPFEPLPKGEKPIVGFCGWRSKPRYEILKKIRCDPRIQENFILRDRFMGGGRLSNSTVYDFDENMKNSHFNICNRGTGNFSMRFYQTLAAGRIPLVVDTDMQLPLYGVADYDNVIIMESTVEKVIEKLIWVWNNVDIIEMQKRCSTFYDKYLHYAEYSRYLHEELKLKNLAS